MITLKSAKKLDKLGMEYDFNYEYISLWDKNNRNYIRLPNPTIDELLQKLPITINGREYDLTLERGIDNKWSVLYENYESILVCEQHKNLAEALSRLLIKITEEKLNGKE